MITTEKVRKTTTAEGTLGAGCPMQAPAHSMEGDMSNSALPNATSKGIAAIGETTRRDFIFYAAAGVATVTAGTTIWPLINSMNPTADVTALSVVEVDLEGVEPGIRITLI